MTEILVILGIILVFLGPEKIPELARMVGKTMREVRKASNLLRDAVMIDEQPKNQQRYQKPVFNSVEIAEAPPKERIIAATLLPVKTEKDVVETRLTFLMPMNSPREVYLHKPFIETT